MNPKARQAHRGGGGSSSSINDPMWDAWLDR
jgi:hypothetical protein